MTRAFKPWDLIRYHDPEIYDLIEQELDRQLNGLELIASENFASAEVLAVMGNILSNKYAEGLPGKRYYGGCQKVDAIEELAIERVKKLFNCNFANVQPHSGAQANAAAFLALAQANDTILGLDLSHGGHLTHGSKVNFSGIIYHSEFYRLNPETETIDYDELLSTAKRVRPKIIVAGASAYPRIINFKKFREICDEVGAYLVVDMAHIAGLVAVGLHPSPMPYADVVTSTTHKTLRGPRGGIILWNNEQLNINKAVFPGIQGGPLEHIIAAKAVCFKEALSESFKQYQKRVIANASELADELSEQGFKLVSSGTDNHLMLVDLSKTPLSGKQLEEALGKVEITVNKNTVPNETRSPFVTSGIRLGTPAVTTRGLDREQMKLIAKWIKTVFDHHEDQEILMQVKKQVLDLAHKFPIYQQWGHC